MSQYDPSDPDHISSSTDQVLTDLQLYGFHPRDDEPDPRPIPEDRVIAGAVADVFDALVATMADTALHADLNDLLWSTVNTFHRAVARIERTLDDNEQAQKQGQREQDGSEVKAVQLEALIAAGQRLIERRDALELFRDTGADLYRETTSSNWSPRTGSRISHRQLTSSLIDSRDFIAARQRADRELLLPTGPKIALTGGLDFNNHQLIWAKLDQVRAKHPEMVLMHGNSPKGAEKIAARWADHRNVVQIGFAPDWSRHGRSAPFKRNDRMLDILPIGVIVFPGTGIQDNLADKASRLGIPVWRFDDT